MIPLQELDKIEIRLVFNVQLNDLLPEAYCVNLLHSLFTNFLWINNACSSIPSFVGNGRKLEFQTMTLVYKTCYNCPKQKHCSSVFVNDSLLLYYCL